LDIHPTSTEANAMYQHTARLGEILRRSSFVIPAYSFALLLTTIGPATASADSYQGSFSSNTYNTVYNDSYNSARYDYPIDFALTLSNSDIDLHEGNTHYPVSLDRISISVFSLEQEPIQFGFITGSSNLSLDNDTAVAGMSLNGYHTGLAVRGHYGRNPQFGFHADYRYQETRHETPTPSAILSWYEWTIAATGKVTFGEHLRVMLGWAYSGVKARRHARGDINDTLNIELDSAPHAHFGLEWLTGTDGVVSIALQRGAYDTVAFNFVRAFN
jgi:hypothetical protein